MMLSPARSGSSGLSERDSTRDGRITGMRISSTAAPDSESQRYRRPRFWFKRFGFRGLFIFMPLTIHLTQIRGRRCESDVRKVCTEVVVEHEQPCTKRNDRTNKQDMFEREASPLAKLFFRR